MRLFVPYTWRNIIAAAHDAFMAAASFILALYLRLGDERYYLAEPYLINGTIIFTTICMSVFVYMRLYRGLWRFASMPDMIALVKAVTISIAAFSILMFFVTRLEGIPRSLPVINWLLLIALLGGPRFAYRALKERTLKVDFFHDARKQIPLLLIGANPAAEMFIRDTRRDSDSNWRVVGLLDNNRNSRHTSIHGVQVYGTAELLPEVVNKLTRKGLRPQKIILCGDAISGEELTQLLEDAESLGLTLGRLPSLSDFKDGKDRRVQIRPIAIEDLLGRSQNLLDREAMKALIAGKRVVITGAGGSIGSELARQIAALAPAKMLLLDNGEHALYQIDLHMQEHHTDIPREARLADVQNREQIARIFADFSPELVFHAAAVKHVPLSEDNPLAALSTNVLGTQNVADACVAGGVQAMVLISTDKAVHPTNVMGASKRLAEHYCQALGASEGRTRFVTVRFGNVLGSTGSVVPRFRAQLEAGGPITVTHPDMVRYFMTIREAVELVVQAAAIGNTLKDRNEVIFVLDMGKPVRIVELANQMIRLAGLKPGEDIEIVYTGLRPGEKLFEELFYDEENVTHTDHKNILIAKACHANSTQLKKSFEKLATHCREGDANAALAELKAQVSDYRSSRTEAA